MPQTISIKTKGKGLYEITEELRKLIQRSKFSSGVLHLFIQHTSASLVVQENADPDVRGDLVDYFDRLAPENTGYRHSAEGPDDMPAHIKTALTASNLCIPVADGRLMLGTWQGIYVFEHRASSQTRNVVLTFIAET